MRRVGRVGFAQVPGVVLDQHDIRQLVSGFAKDERSGALAGLGFVGGSDTTSMNDKIAARFFREMGATDLAKAAVGPKQDVVLKRVGIVASGTAEMLKFHKDKFAVLGDLTSPMFAKSVQKASNRLAGMGEPSRLLSALSLNFLAGVMDDHGKRQSFYADAYRKVVRELHGALRTVTDPAEKAKADAVLRELGIETVEGALAGLGLTPSQAAQAQFTAQPLEVTTLMSRARLPGQDALIASGVFTGGEARHITKIVEEYQRVAADPTTEEQRDIGSATSSPAGVRWVGPYTAIEFVFNWLFGDYRNAWTKASKDNAGVLVGIQAREIQKARQFADIILANNKAGDFTYMGLGWGRKADITPATLVGAWFISNFANSILMYGSSGVSEKTWDVYDSIPYRPYFGNGYLGSDDYGEVYDPSVYGPMRMAGLYTTGTIPKLAFVKQVMVQYLAATRMSKQEILAALARGKTFADEWGDKRNAVAEEAAKKIAAAAGKGFKALMDAQSEADDLAAKFYREFVAARQKTTLAGQAVQFPQMVAFAIALARREALERTGQTGNWEGTEWVPDVNGPEMVPQGTEDYATWTTKTGPLDNRIRWDTIPFVGAQYRGFYKKEPTRHAIGWYGRMGYGTGEKMLDFSPDDYPAYARMIRRSVKTEFGIKTTDDIRTSGGDIPPNASTNRTNWFAVAATKVGGILSVVVDVMSRGLEFAKSILCQTFKWMFGNAVGGVICSIIGTILDFLVGLSMGVTAALFAAIKAVSEFLGHLVNKDVFKAFKALFLGITNVLFFSIGGPIATMTGMPLLKAQEADLKRKAKAQGKNPDDVYPSLESLAEELNKDDPFFVISFVISVIGIVLAVPKGPIALRRAGGELAFVLCPVLAIFLAPSALKEVESSNSEWIKKYKGATIQTIRAALTSIFRLLCIVVIGIISMAAAFNMIKDRWRAYVINKGGTGKAAVATVKFFAKRMGAELVVFFGSLIAAASNGFQSGPAMDIMSQSGKQLLKMLPEVIIAFAGTELGMKGKELDEFAALTRTGFDSIEAAKQEYITLKEIFEPTVEGPSDLTVEDVETKKKPPKVEEESRSKALLPVLGLAAGLVVGFMFFGGSRDA